MSTVLVAYRYRTTIVAYQFNQMLDCTEGPVRACTCQATGLGFRSFCNGVCSGAARCGVWRTTHGGGHAR